MSSRETFLLRLSVKGKEEKSSIVYISQHHIIEMHELADGTRIKTEAGEIVVNETVNAILGKCKNYGILTAVN